MGLGFAMASASLGGVGGFTPAQLPGLVLWLRADLGITLNGASVSTWADQSGQGNNGSQATGTKQPAYNTTDPEYGGKPSLAFASGASQWLQLVGPLPPQPSTVYVVGESTSGAGQQQFFGDSGHNCTIFIATGSAIAWTEFAGTILTSGVSTQGVPLAFAGIFNGASSAIYINSSSAPKGSGNSGSFSPSGTQAVGAGNGGANEFLNGKIVEIVAFEAVHTQAQIAQMFAYFASLYGGAWS